MIKVIVNADDFGLDENRTRAIIQAYQEGWVSTTTAIVTTDWFQKAVDMAKGLRLHRNIGLHLNLTEGFPLTERIRESSLFCNPDGSFNARFHASPWHRLYLTNYEAIAVREEVEAQFSRFLHSGLSCRHIDSHHHIHTDFSIANIVLPLVVKARFRTIRLSRNLGVGLNLWKRLYKHFINGRLASCKGVSLNADYFCNFDDLRRNVGELPDGCTVEVMTHPLFSRNRQLGMDGELTEFHWDCRQQKEFWSRPSKCVQLVDYEGAVSQ